MCCIRYPVILEHAFSRPDWYGRHLYFSGIVLADTTGTSPVVCSIPIGWCQQYITYYVLFSSGGQNPIIQQWCHLPNLVTADDALISGASSILCTNEGWWFSALFHQRNTHFMEKKIGLYFQCILFHRHIFLLKHSQHSTNLWWWSTCIWSWGLHWQNFLERNLRYFMKLATVTLLDPCCNMLCGWNRTGKTVFYYMFYFVMSHVLLRRLFQLQHRTAVEKTYDKGYWNLHFVILSSVFSRS